MSNPALEVVGLHKRYGQVHAVRGVSFTLARGQTFGLLGPNGAGKSTVLGMITGLIAPDQGHVTLHTRSGPAAAGSPAARASLGFAPQALALYPTLTCGEQLRLFARLHGVPPAATAEAIANALAMVGLTEHTHTRAEHLSGGMMRRLNFAVAVVHAPAFLLLDEPTVAIDPHSRHQLLEAMATLRRQGVTMLLTTHHMEEAERLCDEIAIVDHGHVIAQGSLAQLLTHCPHPHVVTALRDDGHLHREPTEAPAEVVARLAAAHAQDPAHPHSYSRITVERPDLEHVFMQLTGHGLRDEGATA